MSVTPGRATILQVGVGEKVLTQQSWTLQRNARDIRPLRSIHPSAIKTANVFCTNGDAWLLKPQFSETIEAIKQGGYIQPEDVELAPGVESFTAFSRRDDLPGLEPDASLPASGVPMYQKRVNAAADWNEARLEADEAALPSPPAPAGQSYPLDRVLSGFETFPPNTPFNLFFRTPELLGGTDVMLGFLWGGETETKPDGTSGGQMALSFRGGGTAQLWEHDAVAGDWGAAPVDEFHWNTPGEPPGGMLCSVAAIPYATNRLFFVGPYSTPYSTDGFALFGYLMTVAIAAAKRQTASGMSSLYLEKRSATGHLHRDFMTGEGTVRVDVQRPHRIPFGIIRGLYPEEGTLVDSPFEINRYLPENTPIRVQARAYLYPGTDILCQVYNAATHTPLAQDANGAFLSVAGQRKYYVVLTFASNGIGTPALWSYTVDVEGAFTTQAAVPLVTHRLRRVSVLGPDLDVTSERASVAVTDEIDEASVLREQDRLRTLISVLDTSTGDVIGHLFEGETNQPAALHRGNAGDIYPSESWHDYDLRLAGMWARLTEQFHEQPPFSFASSDTGPTANIAADPDGGGYLPWRVTDVIRWLLNHAGVPGDELDVPDLDFRFWPSESKGGMDTLAIYPHAYYGPMAAALIKDYLGGVLIRDPNAGTSGMWRVLIPPSPISLNILWTFSRDPPPVPGRLVTAPGAYGAGISFILKDTWQVTPEAPRASVVTVIGINENGEQVITRIENNAAIAYLNGRRVPVKYGPDPTLITKEAVNWLARRIDDAVCQPRLWFDFTAPLVWVRDPQDPLQNPNLLRPLRHNDLIYIRREGVDYRAILKSVNPSYESDLIQMAHYQGRMLPV